MARSVVCWGAAAYLVVGAIHVEHDDLLLPALFEGRAYRTRQLIERAAAEVRLQRPEALGIVLWHLALEIFEQLRRPLEAKPVARTVRTPQ